jgi:hypothetical protein
MEVIKKKRAPRKKLESVVVAPKSEDFIDLPDFMAVGMLRQGGKFLSVTLKVKDGHATVFDKGEPNEFGIAYDDMKINLQKRIIDVLTA